MKKSRDIRNIAIFTMRSKNYGNRLQNYALQRILEGNGYHCRTLQDKSIEEKVLKLLAARPNLSLWKPILKIYLKNEKHFKRFLKRADNFELFDYKYIKDSKYYIASKNISLNLQNQYDAFIAGSDQIWNTTFGFVTDNYFLPFKHPCKVAYAASFGVESIPYTQNIVDSLNNLKALSVREEAGAKIIKDLTGREAPVLVDPTLLLTQDAWRDVFQKPEGAKSCGYILTYFLSAKSKDAIQKLKEVKGEKLVYELKDPKDKVVKNAGPSEFLWLFDHADLILTDSFHACVFSFLFNKPFIVYDRNWNEGNMNSRLETFLSKFKLERKYANSGLDNDIWEHDYEEGYRQLEIERKKAMDFLREALED